MILQYFSPILTVKNKQTYFPKQKKKTKQKNWLHAILSRYYTHTK